MKICFVCASLEEGKDGVGDYCRRLANELTQSGHSVAILAFNDRFAGQITEFQSKDGLINFLRLPESLPVSAKIAAARKWIRFYNPEWFSLQYVPYGFHLKGMPFQLASALKKIGGTARWHITFHEIWLSEVNHFRQRIVQKVQKQLVRLMVKRLHPGKIHATILENSEKLKQAGINNSILQLFGNIGFSSSEDLFLQSALLPFEKTILYFGASPRGTFLDILLNKLAQVCRNHTSKIGIVIVGADSITKTKFLERLKSELPGNVSTIDCGFLEPSSISFLMRNCTVGIVRSSPGLLGKSGTAIAMLEFGLPIWLPKMNDGEPIDWVFRSDLVFNNLEMALSHKSTYSYQSILPGTALQFTRDLQSL